MNKWDVAGLNMRLCTWYSYITINRIVLSGQNGIFTVKKFISNLAISYILVLNIFFNDWLLSTKQENIKLII